VLTTHELLAQYNLWKTRCREISGLSW
jgi:hypothetical protein